MININKNEFVCSDAYEDIEDENTIYLDFTNNKGITFIEVREGNIEDFEDKKKTLPNRSVLLEKSDFTTKTWDMIKYAYDFWITSCNGLNAFIEPDVYADDGYSKQDFEEMFDELSKLRKEVPEVDEITFEDCGNDEMAINIYPKFIEAFNKEEIFENMKNYKGCMER